MAAQGDFSYQEALDLLESNQFNHIFPDLGMAEYCTSNADLLVHSSTTENYTFVNDFADNVWDEYGDLPYSLTQENLPGLDSFGLDLNGDSISLEPWCEALSTNFDLLPELQSKNPSLSCVQNSRAAEWSMSSGYILTDTPSSNTVPFTPGNSYQSTPNLTECSTHISPIAPKGFSSPTIENGSTFDTESHRWHAIMSRSRAADRYFLYGVLTTKIFYRPSCASRRPSRRHVRYFSFPGAIETAEQAKFQPCKRCKPETLGTGNTGVLAICQVLRRIIAETFGYRSEAKKEGLKLESLAKSAGLSTFHFHRLFKVTCQVTPADFITACHALALQDALCTYSTQGTRLDPGDVQLSPRWSKRTACKALGGLSPEGYANGTKSTSISYCRVSAPFGDFEVAYSKDKKSPNLHAVVPLQDSSLPTSNHFLTSKRSEEHLQRLQQCVRDLEEKCHDRDVDLATDVLSVLWRARLWLKPTHDNGLE